MDEDPGFYTGMRLERWLELRGQNRLPPVDIKAPHVNSEAARHVGKPLPEISIDPDQDRIAWREKIHHGDLPTGRSRGGPRQDVAVCAMDFPRQLERLAVQSSERRSAMRDHLLP